MLDENSKKKLRRLWYKRLGISFGLALVFWLTKGLSIVLTDLERAQVHLERVEMQRWVLEHRQTKRDKLRARVERLDHQVWLMQARRDKVRARLEWLEQRWAMQAQQEQDQIKQFKSALEDAKQARAQLRWTEMALVLGFKSLLLILIIMLPSLLKMQNQTSLSFAGQLICFLPEEYIAELEALSEQLKSNNCPTWVIQTITFKCFLELMFAFYIQIKIDNFRLPSKRK